MNHATLNTVRFKFDVYFPIFVPQIKFRIQYYNTSNLVFSVTTID